MSSMDSLSPFEYILCFVVRDHLPRCLIQMKEHFLVCQLAFDSYQESCLMDVFDQCVEVMTVRLECYIESEIPLISFDVLRTNSVPSFHNV